MTFGEMYIYPLVLLTQALDPHPAITAALLLLYIILSAAIFVAVLLGMVWFFGVFCSRPYRFKKKGHNKKRIAVDYLYWYRIYKGKRITDISKLSPNTKVVGYSKRKRSDLKGCHFIAVVKELGRYNDEAILEMSKYTRDFFKKRYILRAYSVSQSELDSGEVKLFISNDQRNSVIAKH